MVWEEIKEQKKGGGPDKKFQIMDPGRKKGGGERGTIRTLPQQRRGEEEERRRRLFFKPEPKNEGKKKNGTTKSFSSSENRDWLSFHDFFATLQDFHTAFQDVVEEQFGFADSFQKCPFCVQFEVGGIFPPPTPHFQEEIGL